jgi:hypothetical protein
MHNFKPTLASTRSFTCLRRLRLGREASKRRQLRSKQRTALVLDLFVDLDVGVDTRNAADFGRFVRKLLGKLRFQLCF